MCNYLRQLSRVPCCNDVDLLLCLYYIILYYTDILKVFVKPNNDKNNNDIAFYQLCVILRIIKIKKIKLTCVIVHYAMVNGEHPTL